VLNHSKYNIYCSIIGVWNHNGLGPCLTDQMLSSLIVVSVVYANSAFPGNQLFSKLCVNYLPVCCTENGAILNALST